MFNTNHPLSGQKGVSLLFVFLIMSVILSISLGVSGILVQQSRMLTEIAHSVISFYAADSGIERELYELYKVPPEEALSGFTGIAVGSASYDVEAKCGALVIPEECPPDFVIASEDECNSLNYCIKSIGSYQKTKRGIKIKY